MPTPTMLIVAVLTTWRITHLFHAEDGPGKVLVRFRALFGDGLAGQVLDCFYCLSVWVALPLAYALGTTWIGRLWLWPALSGAACLLHGWTRTDHGELVYEEQEEA